MKKDHVYYRGGEAAVLASLQAAEKQSDGLSVSTQRIKTAARIENIKSPSSSTGRFTTRTVFDSSGSLTRALRRLESRGLVTLRKKGRSLLVSTTEKGRSVDLLARADEDPVVSLLTSADSLNPRRRENESIDRVLFGFSSASSKTSSAKEEAVREAYKELLK